MLKNFLVMINDLLTLTVGGSVMLPWTNRLSHIEQSTLISVIRGTDIGKGFDKDAKNITRMLRYLIIKNSTRKSKFISDRVVPISITIKKLKDSYYDNPHWVEHVQFAARLISNKHSNPYVKTYWGTVARVIGKDIKNKKKVLSQIRKYEDIYNNRYI